MTSVAVVGGGISGLAAARQLTLAGARVTVLEASGRWGGKLDRTTVRDLALDTGAESLLARRPEAMALVDDLGLGPRLVHPTAAKPALLVGGRLHVMPPSLQGVPVDVEALAGLLSPAGFRYAAAEPERPAPPLHGDVAVGSYLEERFGAEVTDRLLEPLLGGVYAGRSRDLSFAAVMPDLFARARTGGSLLVHARAARPPSAGTPVFAGLVGGVAGLVDALVADLRARGATLRAGTVVRTLRRRGQGWLLGCGAGTETVEADAVVLAAPAGPAGRLLSDVVPTAATYAAVPYASVAVLTLVLRGLQTDRSGVLVPPGELPTIKALTHSSVKWAWVGEQAELAWGPGVTVVRVSVGRAGEASALQLPDDALLERTVAEARTLPGWAGVEVLHARLTRWGGALPQYRLGHRELVAGLRAGLAATPGLAVAGAALDGVGIAACLGSAALATTKIVDDLGLSDHDRLRTTYRPENRRQESQR
ncbi:MAG: Protoporphyrinogen IX oxidase, aerobic, HemY [uncultured Friedmanniella sp.]|uniref:Coproporphyrinogen III oxidase n=1 Tax=uncultured Friedmanniella sp. TaxID=335381 RepID=A0A6J4KUR6_9ACTN|nr:protoporphyrinogen oxidase [uncultured Friedmanniella sp.]CAA9314532.1 MAG: Protoporphyrinogen IX oxidase, aerobic, HemY [uncultured Friedmanniella sp.]